MEYAHVVAASRNHIIGKNGKLPWHLPEDLQRFKELTTGHVLIMGRKTYDSIGRPLPGRFTIVVSRQSEGLMLPRTASLVHSLEEAYQLAESLAPHWGTECFIVGGGEIYRQSLAKICRVYLTEVDIDIDGDTSYPPLDKSDFVCKKEERVLSKDPSSPEFKVLVYERLS